MQAVLLGLLLCLTAAQCTLALNMRRFGKQMDRPEAELKLQLTPELGLEKARLNES